MSTVEDLIANIQSDTVIELAAGEYDLGAAVSSTNPNVWYEDDQLEGAVYTGIGATFGNVSNLEIRAAEGTDVLLYSSDSADNVLVLDNCSGITFDNITLGHKVPIEEVCSASVLYLFNTTNVMFTQCDVYGCGTVGFLIDTSSQITVDNSVIHDCLYGACEIYGSSNITFSDSVISNNGNEHASCLFYSSSSDNISINGGAISDNGKSDEPYENMIESDTAGSVSLIDCTLSDNYYTNIGCDGYDVHFDIDGASAAEKITANGTKITAPEIPDNPGHTLIGWFTDPGLTDPWDFNTETVTGDTTLYAEWREGTHFLRIDMHDSYGDGWNDGAIEIYLNGDYIKSVTLDDGYEGTENFDGLKEGDELDFVWITGRYDYEASFEFYCESYDTSFDKLVCSCEDADYLSSDTAFFTYSVGDESSIVVGGQEWEQDGVTWNYTAQGTTCRLNSCSQQTGALIIPAVINGFSVTDISEYAFSSNDYTSVVIPEGVKKLGFYAFGNCNELTGVTIPASVEDIGPDAFGGCAKLAAINVSASNTHYKSVSGVLLSRDGRHLMQYPAGNASTSYSIPTTVQYIDFGAFESSYKLTAVTIPASVDEIDAYAFVNCDGLASVTVPYGVLTINFGAFMDCGKLGTAYISASVTEIGDYAFAECGNLYEAHFMGNVPSSFGDYVFDDASASFAIYFIDGMRGWTTPAWNGYPAVKVPLAAPVLSAVTPASYNSIKVSWNAVSGASGYQLYRATSANGKYSLVKTTKSTSCTNTSLKTGTTYYYKVSAYKTVSGKKVYSDYSPVLSAKPVLAKVSSATAKVYGTTSVKISWSKVAGRSGYEVWRSTSPSSGFVLIKSTSSTSYKNTKLTPSVTGKQVTYYYKVRAYRKVSGVKVYSDFTAVTSASPTFADVSSASASTYSPTGVKISWGKVSGRSGYEVWRSTSPSSGFALIKSTSSTSYKNTKLTPFVTYYYMVRAYVKVGRLKVFSALTPVSSASPTFANVSGVSAVRSSATKVKISWSKVTGASGYEVLRSASAGGTYTVIKSTTSRSYTNTKLTTGVTYYYKVRAYVKVGGVKVYSAESGVVSATP